MDFARVGLVGFRVRASRERNWPRMLDFVGFRAALNVRSHTQIKENILSELQLCLVGGAGFEQATPAL
jgi:hypothetical protein